MSPQKRFGLGYNTMLSLFLVPVLAGLGVLFTPATAVEHKLRLLPLPHKYTVGEGVTCLSEDFGVTFESDAPEDLRAAADRMLRRIASSKHRFLSPELGAEFYGSGCDGYITSLHLTFTDSSSIATHAVLPVEQRSKAESYKLHVPVDGTAQASGDTALGTFRALTTFENLLYKADGSRSTQTSEAGGQVPLGIEFDKTYAPFAPYDIDDKPAFPWRAVLLDTSRHFFPKQSILKMLDTMAGVKLNVFHWHITDSEAWPLELSDFPRLAAMGAHPGDNTYSEADVREIEAYAAERGIDVVLEIDTPGHTGVMGIAYPDYVACRDHRPWTGYAHQPPTGQLRFADPEVADFAARIFTSASSLTRSKYFGTGGDEINMKCMAEDAPTQAKLGSGRTIIDALEEFTAKTHQTLRDIGRTPLVWQEMVLDYGDIGINKNTIVDIWVNSRDVRAVLDKGYRIIHASADYFYLDCGQGGWIAERGGGNSWCDPFKSWARMYSFDPYSNVAEEQRELVLGGQASLWAEQTDDTNFESVMWPRAAAVAELFWTGASHGSFPLDSVAALPRMHDIRYRMVDRGVRAVPLQPEWCARNPTVCVLNG